MDKLTKVFVERKKNIKLRRDLHNLANDQARGEILDSKLSKFKREPVKLIKKTGIKQRSKSVVYVVGDVHYRGKIDDTLVLNTFAAISGDIHSHKYTDVELGLTGDNIDGEIHEEQQRTNEPIVDATIQLIDLYINCIRGIPQIKHIRMVYGNHEEIRLGGDKNTENNIGKLIAHGLKKGLTIPVDAGEELIFKYKNKNVLLLHGHQGYAKSKAKIIEHCAVQYGMIPETIVLGHFHTSKANQFSKNHWLITAPAVKNGAGRGDKANGFCGLGQFIKLKLNYESPQITTMSIGD